MDCIDPVFPDAPRPETFTPVKPERAKRILRFDERASVFVWIKANAPFCASAPMPEIINGIREATKVEVTESHIRSLMKAAGIERQKSAPADPAAQVRADMVVLIDQLEKNLLGAIARIDRIERALSIFSDALSEKKTWEIAFDQAEDEEPIEA